MSNRLILLGLAAFAAGLIARVATEPPQSQDLALVGTANAGSDDGMGGSGR